MIFLSWWARLAGRAPRTEITDVSEADKTTLRQMDAFFNLLIDQPHEFFVAGSEGRGRCSLSSIWVARILHAQCVSTKYSAQKLEEVANAGRISPKDVKAIFHRLDEAGTFEVSKSLAARVGSYFCKPSDLKPIHQSIATIAKVICATPESPSSVRGFMLTENQDTNVEKYHALRGIHTPLGAVENELSNDK